MKYIKSTLYTILLISHIVLISSGCTGKKEKADYTINLSRAENDISSYNFIEDISYIQLETNENSLIGYITKLYISDNRIYVLDTYITRSLFVFDFSGKFINKISRLGRGPGEYSYLLDFVVDDHKQEILLLVDANRIIRVSMSGQLLGEQKLELYSSYLLPLDDDKFILGNDVTSGNDYLIYFTNNKFMPQKKYCPKYDGYENIAITKMVNYSGCDNNYLFHPPLSPVIYAINENGCFPKYEFDVDKQYKLTENKIAAFRRKDLQEIVDKTKDYFSIHSFFDLEEKLFVTFSLKQEKYWGMYNREMNKFNYIHEDKLKKAFGIDTGSFYFLSKLNEGTIIGCKLSNQEIPITTGDGLNPTIIICKIK
jgi:hypothetical protein